MNRSMPALGWWLIAVGAFRSAYTFSCFFGSTWLSSATFSAIHSKYMLQIMISSNNLQRFFPNHDHLMCVVGFSIIVTSVHGRTVGVWTLLSCTLCFMCAFNLDSKPVYMATFLSFFYAITYLGIECLIYHSIHFASLVPFIFIADNCSWS
ncbi:hypothetical protein U9M48_000414 [Paspalum notatum var. saurae]|uniref:Uncharacterized protein n=1 Tax=Paspalum notatum var. saurae TaxID=547442 RepID=A0AAQ3PF79_PASNO